MVSKNKFTGERLEPFLYDANAVKHLHRYAITSKYVEEKVVLDIASGEGYGSNLMSDNASFVYGVDIDDRVVEMARQKYGKSNIQFLVGSTSNIPLEENSIDVVVSYETIEHHDEHEQMFQEIKRVLRSDGICLISTPDKHYYSDERNYSNKFHIKELYKSEFIELVKKYFSNCQILSQSYLNGNSIVLDDNSRNGIEFQSGDFKHLIKVSSPPQFIIAIASDSQFEEQKNSVFDGGLILNNLFYQEKLKKVYKSRAYRLGKIILSPVRLLQKFRR